MKVKGNTKITHKIKSKQKKSYSKLDSIFNHEIFDKFFNEFVAFKNKHEQQKHSSDQIREKYYEVFASFILNISRLIRELSFILELSKRNPFTDKLL